MFDCLFEAVSESESKQVFKLQVSVRMRNRKPWAWITVSLVALIAVLLNGRILWKESAKRAKKHEQIKFATVPLKIWSLICIVSGFIWSISMAIRYLNGICRFEFALAAMAGTIQHGSMGFYQLCSLKRCFFNSDLSYSNYVFIIMYIMGFLNIILGITYHWFVVDLQQQCGIDPDTFSYYFGQSEFEQLRETFYAISNGIHNFITVLWGIVILLLYIIKVFALKIKIKDRNGKKSVMTTLSKIFILTLFYQLIGMLTVIFAVINLLVFGFGDNDFFQVISLLPYIFASVAMSVSMYLMQEHNNKEYESFLKLIQKWRLGWVCCNLGRYSMNIVDAEFKLEKSEKETTTDTEDLYLPTLDSGGIPVDVTNHNTHNYSSLINGMDNEMNVGIINTEMQTTQSGDTQTLIMDSMNRGITAMSSTLTNTKTTNTRRNTGTNTGTNTADIR